MSWEIIFVIFFGMFVELIVLKGRDGVFFWSRGSVCLLRVIEDLSFRSLGIFFVKFL